MQEKKSTSLIDNFSVNIQINEFDNESSSCDFSEIE